MSIYNLLPSVTSSNSFLKVIDQYINLNDYENLPFDKEVFYQGYTLIPYPHLGVVSYDGSVTYDVGYGTLKGNYTIYNISPYIELYDDKGNLILSKKFPVIVDTTLGVTSNFYPFFQIYDNFILAIYYCLIPNSGSPTYRSRYIKAFDFSGNLLYTLEPDNPDTRSLTYGRRIVTPNKENFGFTGGIGNNKIILYRNDPELETPSLYFYNINGSLIKKVTISSFDGPLFLWTGYPSQTWNNNIIIKNNCILMSESSSTYGRQNNNGSYGKVFVFDENLNYRFTITNPVSAPDFPIFSETIYCNNNYIYISFRNYNTTVGGFFIYDLNGNLINTFYLPLAGTFSYNSSTYDIHFDSFLFTDNYLIASASSLIASSIIDVKDLLFDTIKIYDLTGNFIKNVNIKLKNNIVRPDPNQIYVSNSEITGSLYSNYQQFQTIDSNIVGGVKLLGFRNNKLYLKSGNLRCFIIKSI